MTINSMLKTLKGDYYTEVNDGKNLSISADTNYLRQLAKMGDPRTRRDIDAVYMNIFYRATTNENQVHMHIALK